MADTPESANQPSTNPPGQNSPADADNRDVSSGDPDRYEGPSSGSPGGPFGASTESRDRFQGPSFGQESGAPGYDSSSRRSDPFGGSSSTLDDVASMLGLGHIPLQMAKSWVRDHQTRAMLGAFAVGVFIGAISRD